MLDPKLVPQFNLTMRCNMYRVCPYCYVKEQLKDLPQDMDPALFAQVLNWFRGIGIDEIILLGGEPPLHPLFGDILSIIQEQQIATRMFTNGTYSTSVAQRLADNAWIKTFFFHYDQVYMGASAAAEQLFTENLDRASRAHKTLWLRWNINRPDDDPSRVIDLARSFGASIAYSITVPTQQCSKIPIEEVHQYADTLIRLVQTAEAYGIPLEPARAFPLCAFSESQLGYLTRQANLQGCCVALNDLTVNTDGSIQLCSITHNDRTSPLTGVEDLQRKMDDLRRQEDALRRKAAIEACIDCVHSESGRCQGGCYAYKLYQA